MTPYHESDGVTLYHGDCLQVLRTLPADSIDAVVSDPPYGLSFMGKRWDYDVPATEVWAESLRVLKPGGHLLAFAGTRTQHRMAVRIEDAGFEIRDMIAWVYGSGFPKSLDVSKAIDKAAGAERTEVVGSKLGRPGMAKDGSNQRSGFDAAFGEGEGSAMDHNVYAPATPEAQRWQGWGTALKPSHETITWATKPVANLPELHSIRWSLLRKEAQLWLMLFVSAAENSSVLSQSEFAVACGFAQWSADDARSTLAGLCGQMDTSQCVSAINTTLNTVSSWRSILDAVCEAMNTSTIATKLSTITDWTTWSFCLSQITLGDIIQEHSPQSGVSSSASSAVRAFQGWIAFCKSILGHFATENAIAKVAQDCQAAGVSPNMEPCIMARKPLSGTVAENVLQYGTGALNVDGCRVGETVETWPKSRSYHSVRGPKPRGAHGSGDGDTVSTGTAPSGRWPANLIHDGSDEVTGLFPETGPSKRSVDHSPSAAVPSVNFMSGSVLRKRGESHNDAGGSAARFFYCAKASKRDRGESNRHPTVKPTALMRYLCKLITPPGGLVLDPFTGSGSTGRGAVLEGFRFVGMELDAEHIKEAKRRILEVQNGWTDEPEDEPVEDLPGQRLLF